MSLSKLYWVGHVQAGQKVGNLVDSAKNAFSGNN
jgi:hypothetical protein